MELPFQLISTDFDGTVFSEFERQPVPPGLQQLLADLQARGARWVINTGRDLTSLLEAMARARLTVQPDFLVLVEREIHVRDGASFNPLEPWNSRCAADHAQLFAEVAADVPRLAAWVRERFEAAVYADPWSPFCLVARRNSDADVIHAWLNDYCAGVPNLTVVRNDVYARFSHAAYSKGSALGEICRGLGVSPERVFAAGDHLNDLPMLSRERARWLAAPANAIPAVKEAVRAGGGFVATLPAGLGVEQALIWALETAR
ncbi:MAG: HAD family phosphatase [Verrucomicrobia bacterium]|nr:HAD family phosphatase [Verrucomicrobiota bacterium]